MLSELRNRWPLVFLAPFLILVLGPTPVPHTLVAAIDLADLSISSNHPETALESLEAILEFEPSYAKLHVRAAQVAIAAERPTEALEHLEAADRLQVEDPSIRCLRGEALLAEGDLQGAISSWEEAVVRCPQEEAAYEAIAHTSLADVDPNHMLVALQKLAASEPDNPDLQLRLALISATLDPEGAVDQLRLAEDLLADDSLLASDLIHAIRDPQTSENQAATLARVGETLASHGEWALATLAFRQARDLQPNNARATAYLGLALERTGKDGLPYLQDAAAQAPDDPLPLTLLGMYWLDTDQPQKALQKFQIAADLDPSNPALKAQLGAALADLGRLEQAMDAYRMATDLAPDQASFWLLLAQFALAKEYEISTVALPAARNAVILGPEEPAVRDALGYAHLLLGNHHLASRFLTQAVDMEPRRALTQYHLALLRLTQDRPLEAMSALEMAIQLDPIGPVGNLAARLQKNLIP